MKLLIRNIKTIYGIREKEDGAVCGKKLGEIASIDDAWILMEDEIIKDYGLMANINNGAMFQDALLIDAHQKLVLPSFVDSHTHIVFAATREGEFVDRIKGLSYEEIAARGGGILNSADKLQLTSEDQLFESALERLNQCIGWGTGAIEIKSGYGLTFESELKMLRVIKRLKSVSPIAIKSTFLGAHAMPTEYKHNRKEYIKIVTEEMIPAIVSEKLADYCDVFCDQGFYTPEETEIILKAANKLGLKAKIHANELGLTGGVQVGVANQAISVDHLEHISKEEILLLQKSNTIPTLLPSTAFFLGIPYPDARAMIDANLPVCLASDFNPGSSPSGRMSFVMSLACLRMKMTPIEAFNASTINGAYALELQDSCGSITRGKVANLMITKPAADLAVIPYTFGTDIIEQIVLNGKVWPSIS